MTTISISDHAVLRYLERVHGLDIDGLRATIAARVQPIAAKVGRMAPAPGRYAVRGTDVIFVVDGAVVVTALSAGARVRLSFPADARDGEDGT